MSLLIRFILNALALWVTTLLYSGISFGPGTGLLSVLWAGIALALLNALLRPILVFLTLPINFLTLGLFSLVINAIILLIVAALTRLEVRGFGSAVLGGLILAIVNWLITALYRGAF